jgi:predicted GNAT family acetyltransferase
MRELQLSKETKQDGSGRYVVRVEGIDATGEIAFTQRGSNVISADHTEVADELRGKGVARALLEFMVEDAQQSGFRIIPICPFVRAQASRHPEWADLFVSPGESEP